MEFFEGQKRTEKEPKMSDFFYIPLQCKSLNRRIVIVSIKFIRKMNRKILLKMLIISAVLVTLSSSLIAQNKTYSGKTSMFYNGIVPAEGTETYTYIVGDDGKKLMNGSYTFNGSGHWSQYNQSASVKLNITANAVKGKLNGSFKQTQTLTGKISYLISSRTGSASSTLTGTFLNGKPNGLFTAKTNLTDGLNYSVTATLKNGKYTGAYNLSKDKGDTRILKGQLTSDGKLTGTWTWKYIGDYFQDYTNTYTFQNDVLISMDNGNKTTPPAQQELAKKYVAGKISEDELRDNGYVVEKNTLPLWLAVDIITMRDFGLYEVPATADFSEYKDIAKEYKVLIKCDFCTFEECLAFCKEHSDGYSYIMENKCIYRSIVSGDKYYATTETIAKLTEALSPQIDSMYNNACELISKYEKENTIESLESYKEAQKTFNNISIWKDSKSKLEICETRIAEITKITNEESYKKATALINKNKNNKDDLEEATKDYNEAKKLLSSIVNWENPKEINNLIKECDVKINEITTSVYNKKYDQAINLMDKYSNKYTEEAINAHNNAIEIFKSIEGWKESKELIRRCESNIVEITKGIKCEQAKSLMDKYSNEYTEEAINAYQKAIEILESINGWRDSFQLINICQNKITDIKDTEKKRTIIEDELRQIVAHTKMQKRGSVVFSWPYPNPDIFDFGYRVHSHDYQSALKLLNNKLGDYCPMIGYNVNSITKIDTDKFNANCNINIKLPTKIGDYETYEVNFTLNRQGQIIVQDLNFKNAKKIRNEWDELKDNESKILAKSKECKNIVSVYSKYMKTAETTTTEKLKAIIANQTKILKAINSSNAIELDNKVKKLKDKSIESVIKEIQQ